MTKQKETFMMLALILLVGCAGQNTVKRDLCETSSEWRDHNGSDSCSYYAKEESCDKIIGRLHIQSRLHKNTLTDGVFEGGMSSRWLEIGENSITYFKPSGEVADKGKCQCKNGKLKTNWEFGDNLPEECDIYFNDANSVELRYHDYPYDFNTFSYDTTKPQSNPTKIIGIIE